MWWQGWHGRYRLDGLGFEAGATKSFLSCTHVQTNRGAQSASCTVQQMRCLLPRGKAVGAWLQLSTPNKCRGLEWVQMYRSVPSWHVAARTWSSSVLMYAVVVCGYNISSNADSNWQQHKWQHKSMAGSSRNLSEWRSTHCDNCGSELHSWSLSQTASTWSFGTQMQGDV